MRVMISWSGGKESALALHRAVAAGHQPVCLLNCVSEDGARGMSHGVPATIIAAQAKALGLPIVQPRVTWESYEETFRATLRDIAKEYALDGGVFGDIDIEAHRQWVEQSCASAGLTPLLPLWGAGREAVVEEIVRLGFRPVLVNVRADLLNQKWVGRELTSATLAELRREPVDLCGENGEYHTLVIGGPLFKERLVIEKADIVRHGDRFYLNIQDFTRKPCATT